MVLLDTNILVYARDVYNPWFEKAKGIVDRAAKAELEACISLQNLLEFYAVVTSPKRVQNPLTPQEAKEDIEEYVSCPNIKKLKIEETTIRLGIELAEKHSLTRQNIYDAQLVATMLENRVTKILTANVNDFSPFGEIEVEDPFEKI